MRTCTGARRFAAVCVAVVTAAIGLVTAGAPAGAIQTFSFDRLGGGDRYETAAEIALEAYSSSNEAVLATGEQFPDALAGAYLAGHLDAPILLVQRDAVPAATAAALEDLGVNDVYLLGGTAAISAAVESDLEADYDVTRLGGADRYATAAAVAREPGTSNPGTWHSDKTAIVATGEAFADALAGGPLAFNRQFPILLTNRTSLPASAAAALDDLGIERVLLLGGTSAVSDAVETQIEAINGISVTRLFGTNRQATAVDIARFALDELAFSDRFVDVATGANFPDALAMAPLSGGRGAPLLFTPHDDPANVSFLDDANLTAESGYIAGGTAAVPSDEASGFTTALRNNGDAHAIAFTADPTFSDGDRWSILFNGDPDADAGDTLTLDDGTNEITAELGAGNTWDTTTRGGQTWLVIDWTDITEVTGDTTVTFPADVTDQSGFDWDLSDSPADAVDDDTTAPTVDSDTATVGTKTFTLVFDEPIDPDSVDAGAFTVDVNGGDPGGAAVTSSATLSSSSVRTGSGLVVPAWTTVSITVDTALAANATVTVDVDDLVGNNSNEVYGLL